MSGWELACLAIMALALVGMATAQLVIALAAARAARQAVQTVQDVRRDLLPLVAKLNQIADDAARVTTLALAQVERVDQVLSSTTERIEETMATIQNAIAEPMRNGAAIIAGLRAAFAAFRGGSHRPHPSRDEEDALFIG